VTPGSLEGRLRNLVTGLDDGLGIRPGHLTNDLVGRVVGKNLTREVLRFVRCGGCRGCQRQPERRVAAEPVPASGERQVEEVAVLLAGEDDVAGAGGDALGAVHGGGVAEVACLATYSAGSRTRMSWLWVTVRAASRCTSATVQRSPFLTQAVRLRASWNRPSAEVTPAVTDPLSRVGWQYVSHPVQAAPWPSTAFTVSSDRHPGRAGEG